MRGVFLEVDERMLAERHRLGLDRFDEMWEGVLHMVPAPKRRHQGLATKLAGVLDPSARRAGCNVYVQAGMYAATNDYRVPDVVITPPASESDRGVDGPPLTVIEVLSPNDESYAKVPWYLARGAGSVVIIDPDGYRVELFTDAGRIDPGADGLLQIPELGARLGPSPDADTLLVETDEGVIRIEV